jgi:predicted DNA-binding transcriptional regulator YafY
MPKSSNHLALARQWELLKRISSRPPGTTARELAEQLSENGFPVTKRTVERDLVDLASQFGIACNDASKPYGWYWLPGRQYDFASVDLVEAVSLSLAGEALERMLPLEMLEALRPKLSQAKQKLELLREHPIVRLPEKLRYVSTGMEFQPPYLKPGVLAAVQQALIEERQIEVVYAPFNSRPKSLRLHPLSLIQHGQVSYLVATAFEYEDIRLYAVHRLESVEISTQTMRSPEGYSVDDALKGGILQFGEGRPIKIKATLSHELATYLSETPISEDQEIQYKKETWQLSATVRDSWQLHFWILSQGPKIEIVQPNELRSSIAESLKQAHEIYT